MFKKHTLFRSALVALFLGFLPCSALADDHNILNDAGFEQRLAPERGGWILFDESMFSDEHARRGKQSVFHWGYSRSVPYAPYFIGTVSGSYQEFPARPGSKWRLTGYGLTPQALKGAATFGIVQVSFFDAKGKDLGTNETAGDTTPAKISNKIDGRSSVGEWIALDTGVATAPEGTAVIQAFTLFVDFSGSDTTQGVYFDDLTLCALEQDEDEAKCD